MPAHDTVLSDPIRYDTIRHDTTRHDTTRHDTTRHDTTRHDAMRYDTLRYSQVIDAPNHSTLFCSEFSCPLSAMLCYAMLPWPNTHSHGIKTGQHLLKSVFCFTRFDQVRHDASLISQPRSPAQRPRLSCHARPRFQRRLEYLSKLCILLIE